MILGFFSVQRDGVRRRLVFLSKTQPTLSTRQPRDAVEVRTGPANCISTSALVRGVSLDILKFVLCGRGVQFLGVVESAILWRLKAFAFSLS